MNSAATFFRLCRQQHAHSSFRIPSAASMRRTKPRTPLASTSSMHLSIVPNRPSNPIPPHMTATSRSASNSSPSGNPSALVPLPETQTEMDEEYLQTSQKIIGRVSRTGTMAKTVAVRTNRRTWDSFLQKHYNRLAETLVHDPENILVEGDVVAFGPFSPSQREARMQQQLLHQQRSSNKTKKKQVKYVLREVVTPFGMPVEQRVPRVITSREPTVASKAGSPRKQHRRTGGRG